MEELYPNIISITRNTQTKSCIRQNSRRPKEIYTLFRNAEYCVKKMAKEERDTVKQDLRKKIEKKNDYLVAKYAKKLEDKFNRKYYTRQNSNKLDLIPYGSVPQEIRDIWYPDEIDNKDINATDQQEMSDSPNYLSSTEEIFADPQFQMEFKLSKTKYSTEKLKRKKLRTK